MKKIILSIVAVAALVAFPMGVKAQIKGLDPTTSSAVSAIGKANIIIPITLKNNTPLNFGTLINTSSAAFTVVADPTTGALQTLPNGISAQSSNPASCASFTVTGAVGATYSITLPTDKLELTGDLKHVGTVSIDTWKTNLPLAGNTIVSGDNNFLVGGTLNVSSDAIGTFSKSFDVTVAYE